MAAITSNGTGGGNWSTGASWTGGVAPVSADTVTIQSGDTITKDTAAGANDCASLTVTGTLAIGSNGVKVGGALTGDGTVTMGANGSLDVTAITDSNNLSLLFIGTAGNEWTLTISSLSGVHGELDGGGPLRWAHGNGTGGQLRFGGMGLGDYVEDFDWDANGSSYIYLYGSTDENIIMRFKDCWFHGGSAEAMRFAGYVHALFDNCVWGKQRGGTTDANGTDLSIAFGSGVYFEMRNCLFVTGFDDDYQPNTGGWIGRSSSHDQVPGDWLVATPGGSALKSTNAAKTGTYGVEMVPNSSCSTSYGLWYDIQIPVTSGDSVTPAIWIKNATADLNLQDAANRFIAICDPGDEWGLYEEIDANTLADVYNNWRQIAFTGGTVGGTTKKGMLTIRLMLMTYVSTGVVYVADGTF